MIQLRTIPWRFIRRMVYLLRRAFFTVDRPDAPTITTTADNETIREAFGLSYFAPNWEFSYRYHGEVLNLSRVEYRPYDGIKWWQTHVRAFDDGDERTIMAHWEPEPTEHPRAHLSERYMDHEHATEVVKNILNDYGVPYE